MPSKWPFSYVIALQILYTFLSFTVVNVTVNLMFHIMLGISSQEGLCFCALVFWLPMQATCSIYHILLSSLVLYFVKDINCEVLHCIMFILSPVIYCVRFKYIPQNYVFRHILCSLEQKTKFQTYIKTTEKIILYAFFWVIP